MRFARRLAAVVFLVLAALSTAPWGASAQENRGAVVEVPVTGVVDPFLADHVKGVIEQAEADGANAVLLLIDTSGAVGSATEELSQTILNASVPVIGYVAPEGASAASGGTYVLLASPVAAMAPATTVGAAQPVGLAGAFGSEGATEDAVAAIRSLAQKHDRNADWAETAVRESATASAEEASRLGVIDVIAPDVATLLEDIDGATVKLGGENVTLDVADAPIRTEDLGGFAGFLHALLNPNLAFIFFWVGLALVAIEFFVPGGIAGTVGALMFIVSLVTLGTLPVQLVGVALLVASIVFFVLELMHPGVGAAAIGGVVCVLLGGWFLFDASAGDVRVSPIVIVPVAAGAAAFFLIAVRAAMRMRHQKVITRYESIVGREGVVVQTLDPRGVVQVAAEEWTADTLRGTPARGDRIRVVAMDGLRLKVEPVDEVVPEGAEPAGTQGRAP
jgi:membrane-bound serine protease (ClpP class)